MRAELQHPEKSGLVAAYGFNNGRLGMWVEIRLHGHLLVERDRLTGETSIRTILDTLAEHGWFEPDDIGEAKSSLGWADVEDLEGGVRIAAEVIVNLREAAGASG